MENISSSKQLSRKNKNKKNNKNKSWGISQGSEKNFASELLELVIS